MTSKIQVRRKVAKQQGKRIESKIRAAKKSKEVLNFVSCNNQLFAYDQKDVQLLRKLEVPVTHIRVDDQKLLEGALKNAVKIEIRSFADHLKDLLDGLKTKSWFLGTKDTALVFKFPADAESTQKNIEALQEKLTRWMHRRAQHVDFSFQNRKGYKVLICAYRFDVEAYNPHDTIEEVETSLVVGNSTIQFSKISLDGRSHFRIHAASTAGSTDDTIYFSRDLTLAPEVREQLRKVALFLLTEF